MGLGLGFWVWVEVAEFVDAGSGIRISGLRVSEREPSVELRVFKIRVSGFGIRVSGKRSLAGKFVDPEKLWIWNSGFGLLGTDLRWGSL